MHEVVPTDECGIEHLEGIKYHGLLDMINTPDDFGSGPLHSVVGVEGRHAQAETKAKWMMDNGADINDVNGLNTSIFSTACYRRRYSFVQELASKVLPDHLSMPTIFGGSPMCCAFSNADYLPIVRMLILRGVPVRPHPSSTECTLETHHLHDHFHKVVKHK